MQRTEAIKIGDPMDPATMMGAQVSQAQQERIVNYLNVSSMYTGLMNMI